MARYDRCATPDGTGWRLDLPADLLDHLNTRVVVPVLPVTAAPRPAARLNPVVKLDGVDGAHVTQFIAAIPADAMGRRVGSLADRSETTIAALDRVFVGF